MEKDWYEDDQPHEIPEWIKSMSKEQLDAVIAKVENMSLEEQEKEFAKLENQFEEAKKKER